jgi:hypothetical protein
VIASDRPAVRTQLASGDCASWRSRRAFDIQVETMPHATYLDQVWKQGQLSTSASTTCRRRPTRSSRCCTRADAAWNETRWNNKPSSTSCVNAARVNDRSREKAPRAVRQRRRRLMHKEVPSIIPVFFDLLAARRDWVHGLRRCIRAARCSASTTPVARRRRARSAGEEETGVGATAPTPLRDRHAAVSPRLCPQAALALIGLHVADRVADRVRDHPGAAGRRRGRCCSARPRPRTQLAAVRANAWG